MKRLAKSLWINLAGVVVVAASGFGSVLLMARWLDTAQFGTVSLLLLLFNSIALLDGVRPVLVFLGASSSDIGRLTRSAEVMMGIAGCAVALLCSAVLALSGWHGLGVPHEMLFSVTLGLYFPLSAYWGLLDSRGETAFTGGLRSVAWTSAYITFAVLAWFRAGLTWYVVAMALMNVGLLVCYCTRLYLVHARHPGSFDPELVRRMWRDAVNNLVFNVSAFVLGSVDRFVLGWQRGAAELGLYSGAYELTTKPAALLRVLAAVLYPEAARSHKDPRFTELWFGILRLLFFAVTCGVSFAVLLRVPIVHLVLGAKFADAADPFGILAIGFALVSVGFMAAIPLQGRGDFKTSRTLYLAAACLMCVFVWPAISLGGIRGAAGLYLASRLVDPILLLAAFKTLDEPVSLARASLVAGSFCVTMLAAWYQLGTIMLLCLAALAFFIGIPRLAVRLRALWYAS